jgi:hypothetical protein
MLLTETRAAEQLREEGYTVLRGVLDVEKDTRPLIDEYDVVLNGLIERLYAEGKLPHKYEDMGVIERLTKFVADNGDDFFDYPSIRVGFSNLSPDHPMYLHPRMSICFGARACWTPSSSSSATRSQSARCISPASSCRNTRCLRRPAIAQREYIEDS